MSATLAGRADTPQAHHPVSLRGGPADAHPPEVGPGQARRRLPQRRPGPGERACEGPLPATVHKIHRALDDLATATGYPADPIKHSSLDIRTNETYRFGAAVSRLHGSPVRRDGCSPGHPARPAPQPRRHRRVHPHQLRHTAASLAIASGADVKAVQQMLGHSSATMTLDTYGHLFEDRLDEVAAAMDAARAGPSNAETTCKRCPVLPEPDLSRNDEAAPDSFPLFRSALRLRTPDRIRTGATALRARSTRSLTPVKTNEHAGQRRFGFLVIGGWNRLILALLFPQCCPSYSSARSATSPWMFAGSRRTGTIAST